MLSDEAGVGGVFRLDPSPELRPEFLPELTLDAEKIVGPGGESVATTHPQLEVT